MGGRWRLNEALTRTLSPGEKEGPMAKPWEGEGVKRPTTCRQGVGEKTERA
jgi:hypothetical protein